MDLNDQATFMEENHRAEALAKRNPILLKPFGYCHWCSSNVVSSALFCPEGCQEDWEKEQAALKREGK